MQARKPKSPRSKTPLDEPALLELAVRSLASRMKSERDLRRKLTERAFPGDEGRTAVDHVIAKLKDLGYLSDERFAADYTRIRQENEKHGRRRVQQGLMQKGIPEPVAQQALSAAYDDTDEVALCRAYIDRKRLRKPEAADREARQKETARIMRRLITAGFTTRTIWRVLREWDAAIEETDIDIGDE